MRRETHNVATRYAAQKLMPWAVTVIKVEGGYMGFECRLDYLIYKTHH